MNPLFRFAFSRVRPRAVSRWALPGALLAALLTVAGCRDGKVTSYRIPKEHDAEMTTGDAGTGPAQAAMPAAAATPGATASTPMATATGIVLTWTAPADWQVKPPGQMRKGSYTLVGADGVTADCSITAFPGAVGGELANINRWRGQVSLTPIAEADLADATTRVSAGELTFTVVDLVSTGDKPQRILGAMVPFEGAMWFFKLSGPDAFVASSKAGFLAFLKTVKASAPVTP
jgi:hypothetical protein